jgi:tetratricopeptide (TPR) repeat protein
LLAGPAPPKQPAWPQVDEALLQAYRLLHDSDHSGAQHAFERLVAARPQDLPPRFGLLRLFDARARLAPALLPEFERHLERFMVDVEARYARNAQDAEAAFYLAAALVVRARYRVEHDKGMWGAARDGARAKRVSEAYVKRHPGHVDGLLALGIYNYYVEIAPAFMRVIRTFLFLPSGNRAEGLKQIERVYQQGVLFRYEAGLILTDTYAMFEGRVADGVHIAERMAREYPGNPDVHFQLAGLYASPAVDDLSRAAAEFEGVLTREDKRPGEVRPARYQARQGLASIRQQQWRIDEAIALLTSTIDQQPAEPIWVMPRFLLYRGNYRGLRGDPGAGDDARRVRATGRWQAWHKNADDLLAWLQRHRGAEATVYAALIPGNRMVAERRWDEAAAAYAAVARDHPGNVQVRYRLAYLRFARGDHAGAAADLAAIAQARDAPAWLKAQALLHVGRAHDLAGRRAEAVRTYERVVDQYERENAAFAARLGLVTPFTRPPA